MDSTEFSGILVTPLKRIFGDKGDIYHAMKQGAPGFEGFGEAYFSTVKQGLVKGWRKHSLMVLNLIVPMGSIRFVLKDDRHPKHREGNFREIILGTDNYARLTVPPGVWMAFQGLESETNLLLNIASIKHDPHEAETLDLNNIPYPWTKSCES
jgi:dTDP-4-dehydrorhamnose 3,5-epimerase